MHNKASGAGMGTSGRAAFKPFPRTLPAHVEELTGHALVDAIEADQGRIAALCHWALSVERDANGADASGSDGLDGALLDCLSSEGLDGALLRVEMIGAAARRLGRMWTEDTCTFSDVTAGVARLCRLARQMAFMSDKPAMVSALARSEPHGSAGVAAFVTTRGEQHALGLHCVADLFRSAGWQVIMIPQCHASAMHSLLRESRVDLLGVSVSVREHLQDAARLVSEARAEDQSGLLEIMMGGSACAGLDLDRDAAIFGDAFHPGDVDHYDASGHAAARIARRGAIALVRSARETSRRATDMSGFNSLPNHGGLA